MAIGQNLRNKLKMLPARMAHAVSGLGPVNRRSDKRYRHARMQHLPDLPALSGLDREICEQLETQGVSVTTTAALGLPMSGEILEAGRQLAVDFASEARMRSAAGQKFLMVTPSATLLRPELFAWGLQNRLLDIVEAYLGLAPAYDGMTIIYTVANGDEEATRRWHRDREDRRMVKIIIYLNDVIANEGGPFQLDPTSDTSDSVANRQRPIVTCEGDVGTVIFADTARFIHRGEPAIATDRAAIFYSYFSRRPRYPFFCERSGLSRKQVASLAAGFAPRQRESILWHERLPWPLRTIPSAPI